MGPISSLLEKINQFANWIQGLVIALLKAFFDVFKDLFVWGFDKLGDIAVSAVQSMDVSGISTNVVGWGSLPAEIINVLGLLGIGQAVGIITAAIAIRLTLQLIPFVRLGS